MSTYVGLAEAKTFLFPRAADDIAEFDTEIISLLPVVDGMIDEKCNRTFHITGTASVPIEKLYEGNGLNYIAIDDVLNIYELKIDDIATVSSEYYLWPYNKHPKQEIRLVSSVFTTSTAGPNVKISARWGYSEDLPEGIRTLVMMLLRNILLHGERFRQIYYRSSIATPEGSPPTNTKPEGTYLWTSDMKAIAALYHKGNL